MPAWQLKITGQEAVVSFSMATIWSKLASSGAFSWFIGMLAKLVLEVLEIFSTLFDFFSEIIFHSSALLGVVYLQVEVDLCWVPGCVGLAIDINNWFLSEVDPEDVLLVSVLLEDRLQALLETLNRGLAGAE